MRILRDQILASTHMDRSGDRIPREALRKLYDQLDPQTMSGVIHDISRPPVVRVVAKRLEELPDGELAIKIDYEILDEEVFAEMGGFSISFVRGVFRSGSGTPSFRVLVNPEQFDIKDTVKSLEEAVPPQITFDVAERVEKAIGVPEAILIVSLWLGGEILKGFLASVGAGLLEKLRSLRRRDGNTSRPRVQIAFYHDREAVQPDVVLCIPDSVDPRAIEKLDVLKLDIIRAESGGCRVVCVLEPSGDITTQHRIDGSPKQPQQRA